MGTLGHAEVSFFYFPFRQFTFFQRVSNQRSFSFPLRGWSLLNVVLLVFNHIMFIIMSFESFFPLLIESFLRYFQKQLISPQRSTIFAMLFQRRLSFSPCYSHYIVFFPLFESTFAVLFSTFA